MFGLYQGSSNGIILEVMQFGINFGMNPALIGIANPLMMEPRISSSSAIPLKEPSSKKALKMLLKIKKYEGENVIFEPCLEYKLQENVVDSFADEPFKFKISEFFGILYEIYSHRYAKSRRKILGMVNCPHSFLLLFQGSKTA